MATSFWRLSEFFQLLQDVVDLLLLFIRTGALTGAGGLSLLIPILLRIEFEVEQVREIAARVLTAATASTPAAALIAEGDLDIAIQLLGAL